MVKMNGGAMCVPLCTTSDRSREKRDELIRRLLGIVTAELDEVIRVAAVEEQIRQQVGFFVCAAAGVARDVAAQPVAEAARRWLVAQALRRQCSQVL